MEYDFMKEAIAEAEAAAKADEVPIGAVIVKDGAVLARAHNEKEARGQALAHAEMLAMYRAAEKLGDWHLYGCELYVTLEPCAMCAGAAINCRVDSVYFGAYDQKAGCCGTLYNLPEDKRFNHRPRVVGGIMEKECAALLSDYFKKKRAAPGES